MPRKTDPKYEIYYATYKKRKEERRNDLRSQEVTMTTHRVYLPIPEVDKDMEEWDYKVAVREVAEDEANKIRHYLLREWCKVSRQQAIIVVYPYVRYINNRVTYKVELTAFDSKRYKEWLRDACGKYAEEKCVI